MNNMSDNESYGYPGQYRQPMNAQRSGYANDGVDMMRMNPQGMRSPQGAQGMRSPQGAQGMPPPQGAQAPGMVQSGSPQMMNTAAGWQSPQRDPYAPYSPYMPYQAGAGWRGRADMDDGDMDDSDMDDESISRSSMARSSVTSSGMSGPGLTGSSMSASSASTGSPGMAGMSAHDREEWRSAARKRHGGHVVNEAIDRAMLDIAVNIGTVHPDSLQEMMSKNVGRYMVCELLIGVQDLVSRDGILTKVGNSYFVLFNVGNSTSTVCDMYSLKFVYIYRPGYLPLRGEVSATVTPAAFEQLVGTPYIPDQYSMN